MALRAEKFGRSIHPEPTFTTVPSHLHIHGKLWASIWKWDIERNPLVPGCKYGKVDRESALVS